MIRIFLLLIVCLLTLSCGGAFKPKKVDTREVSTNAGERARKNIETGRGHFIRRFINRGVLIMNLVLQIQCGEHL